MFTRLKLFLNDRRKEVVILLLFFLISTISFALGYLTAGKTSHAPIIIQKVDSVGE